MSDPLAVETGDRVTFPDVLVARDGGLDLIRLVNGAQVAVPRFLVPAREHRGVVPSTPWQGRYPVGRHQLGASVAPMHRYSALRERTFSLRGGARLLMTILVAPLVIAGYMGLAVLLFLPLLGLRRMFPRRSMSSVGRSDSNASLYSDAGNLCDAATTRA
jgi:hypothetical protein